VHGEQKLMEGMEVDLELSASFVNSGVEPVTLLCKPFIRSLGVARSRKHAQAWNPQKLEYVWTPDLDFWPTYQELPLQAGESLPTLSGHVRLPVQFMSERKILRSGEHYLVFRFTANSKEKPSQEGLSEVTHFALPKNLDSLRNSLAAKLLASPSDTWVPFGINETCMSLSSDEQ
jgi:hypothetical protein